MRRRTEVQQATKVIEPEKAPEAVDESVEPVKAAMRRRKAASKKAPDTPPDFVNEKPPSKEQAAEKAPSKEQAAEKATMDDRSSMLAKRRATVAADLENLVLASGTARVVERVFEVDVWATYERLEEELKIGSPGNRDRLTLVNALDAAQDNARQAHAIFVTAKGSVESFEIDATILAVSMREQAAAELEGEKDRGERRKAITDADVTSKIAALFPDEWRALEEQRSRAKRTVSQLERFADLWKARARNLEVLLETVR